MAKSFEELNLSSTFAAAAEIAGAAGRWWLWSCRGAHRTWLNVTVVAGGSGIG